MDSDRGFEHDIPVVSVIIPAYNCENYIEQCIQSIRDQTLADIEIICINDGSTDQTSKLLHDMASHDCRMRVIDQENKGEGAARNSGLDMARGIFLHFVDADDFLEPTMLQKMVHTALKGSGKHEQPKPIPSSETDDALDICDIVVCGVSSYNTQTNEDVSIPWACDWANFPKGAFNANDNPDMIFHSFQNWTWNKLFSAEFIRRENLRFDEIQRCADLFFVMCALASAQTIRVIPQELYHYRTNNPSSNIATSDRAPLDFYRSFIKVHDWLIERGRFDLVERAFKNWVIGSIFYNFSVLRSWKSFSELFDYLRANNNEALNTLHLLQMPESDYFSKADWTKMQALLKSENAHDFLFALWRESCARLDELTQVECTYVEAQNSFEQSVRQLALATARNLRRNLYTFHPDAH